MTTQSGARDPLTTRALGQADASVPGHGADSGAAADVTSRLITGPAVLGGAGWLADRALDIHFLTPTGILAGLGLAIYVVWLRYGTSVAVEPTDPPTTLNDEEIQ